MRSSTLSLLPKFSLIEKTKTVGGQAISQLLDVRLEQPNTNWAKCIVFDLSCGTRRGVMEKGLAGYPPSVGS